MIYQNAHCFFFRKPHDLASTRGKQESFLDLLFEQEKSEIRASDLASIHQGIKEEFLAHCAAHDIDESEQSYEELIDQLKNTFTKEQEYGLLNRLDTPTGGLLYFAKTPEIYASWKDRQKAGAIDKYYLAVVEKEPSQTQLSLDLAHHSNGKTMLVLDEVLMSGRRKQKIKGKPLSALTTIIESKPFQNKFILTIHINKGRRHQIRAHLAQAGSPIVGDSLYGSSIDGPLQLFSVGCSILSSK